MGSLPGAGTFCRDGPPSLLHFHNGDVFAAEDAAEQAGIPAFRHQRKRVVLALYDLDGTLIRPKSGSKFPRGADDWTWWHDDVPRRLRADVAEGRHVVVLSNQNVHGRMLRDWKEKIRMIALAVRR